MSCPGRLSSWRRASPTRWADPRSPEDARCPYSRASSPTCRPWTPPRSRGAVSDRPQRRLLAGATPCRQTSSASTARLPRGQLVAYLQRIEGGRAAGSPQAGKGQACSPLWTRVKRSSCPAAWLLKNTLIDYWRQVHKRWLWDLPHRQQPLPVGALRPLGPLQEQHVHHHRQETSTVNP